MYSQHTFHLPFWTEQHHKELSMSKRVPMGWWGGARLHLFVAMLLFIWPPFYVKQPLCDYHPWPIGLEGFVELAPGGKTRWKVQASLESHQDSAKDLITPTFLSNAHWAYYCGQYKLLCDGEGIWKSIVFGGESGREQVRTKCKCILSKDYVPPEDLKWLLKVHCVSHSLSQMDERTWVSLTLSPVFLSITLKTNMRRSSIFLGGKFQQILQSITPSRVYLLVTNWLFYKKVKLLYYFF